MSIVELAFAPSSDPRLAAQLADHATSPSPVWLWSADGSHIVWTNAVGAAVFGAADTCESAERLFEPDHPAALEIARLAATLPASGQARLERLRGFGASFGGALTCICSLVPIADDAFAVLVIGTEAAGLPLTLRERVHRLFAGRESALAVFALDGTLLLATNEGRARLGETPTSSALGIAELAAQALTSGRASGVTRYGAITIERLGVNSSAVLAVTFGAEPLEHELELKGRMLYRSIGRHRNCPRRQSRSLRRMRATKGVIRCVSSGKWTLRVISSSAPTSSPSLSGRGPRRRSAGCGARSQPS